MQSATGRGLSSVSLRGQNVFRYIDLVRRRLWSLLLLVLPRLLNLLPLFLLLMLLLLHLLPGRNFWLLWALTPACPS